MPELLEQMYCSQQIVIPPKYPYILKRYCKAAIKTQPYDLLRWSFEYFKALSQNRPPPVKLRLEYPVYSTEGGLTRGCLKVLANQLSSMAELPLSVVKAAWQGFCLDQQELNRILCLCEVYLREEAVPFLHFIAVAGGLLTKTLTHTMILLCESLTKEPDGGSAAIPVQDFFAMYRFLANMDASKDMKYFNGYREGETVESEASLYEEEKPVSEEEQQAELSDGYWEGEELDMKKLTLIDDHVAHTARLSLKLNMPIMGKIERSPSAERAAQIERENYLMERKGRAVTCDEIEEKLRQKSAAMISNTDAPAANVAPKQTEVEEKKKVGVEIFLFDEEGTKIPFEIQDDPVEHYAYDEGYGEEETHDVTQTGLEEQMKEEEATNLAGQVSAFVAKCNRNRAQRIEDLEQTFDEIAAIVDKFNSANYDLGMVAGRQMSTTSGEFIVQQIERDIMTYINEQIAILPDPDLKKKKAKPEEVEMIKDILQTFLDENMDVIVPEIEEVEEEELPIPEITVVYAVPGIGPPVEYEIINEFEKYVFEVCKVQADVFMPRNIRHFMCPPLEKYIEYKYDDDKEELPTGGVITE